MGYRSEIAIVLNKYDHDDLLRCYPDNPIVKSLSNDIKTTIYDGTEYILLYDDWVKWYDSDKYVDEIERFLRSHDHAFIRIGENSDDIEEKYQGDDFYGFIEVERKINTSCFS